MNKVQDVAMQGDGGTKIDYGAGLNMNDEFIIRNLKELANSRGGEIANGDLRLSCVRSPLPFLPQVLLKAGIRRLIIESTSNSDWYAGLPENEFKWQGIDGSRIETVVLRGEVTDAALTRSVWTGELPGMIVGDEGPIGVGTHTDDTDHWNEIRNAEFLKCITTPKSLSETESTDLSPVAQGIADLAAAIDTRGLKRPVLVISNLSYFANEAVAIPIKQGEMPVAAIGPDGDAQPVQILEDRAQRFALFIPKNLPLHGYAVWDLGATLIPAESDDEVTVSRTHLENSALRVEFDALTGLILRIFDKDSERELLGETFEVQRSGKRQIKPEACANLLSLASKPDGPIIVLERAEVVENGPVRGAIRFIWKLPDSQTRISQLVRLTSGSARIDFCTEIEWEGSPQALAAGFPVAINSARASYQIPYGFVERPTYVNRVEDEVRCESLSCRWVDLSEGDYGVSLLGDSAGSNSLCVKENRLIVTGSPRGVFNYSLLPHGGEIREGELVETSSACSNPPIPTAITGNRPGSLPLERSFFEVDNASVFIEEIYRDISDRSIIVRLREAYNTRGEVLLTTTLPVKKAFLCDLLECDLVEIPLESGEALLPVQPFEIITVKFLI